MATGDKTATPRSGGHTVIGSSIVVDGEISGDEELVVQGTVKGKISLKESLFVERSGTIEADIDTANVEVSGQVTGNISASEKVELKTDDREPLTVRVRTSELPLCSTALVVPLFSKFWPVKFWWL